VVYFHFYDYLYDYGLRKTSDIHAVEDAIQISFLNIIKQRENLSKVNNLPGYLISTFRRQLFSDLKKQKQMIPFENISDEHFEYFKISDSESLDKKELEDLYHTVNDCISNLTDRQKEILYLRFEKGVSYDIISEMLNITVDSCYKSVYRTVNILKEEVEKVIGSRMNALFLALAFLATIFQ
jgi:RNA polymerase sigma factor (sigma-70 family)